MYRTVGRVRKMKRWVSLLLLIFLLAGCAPSPEPLEEPVAAEEITEAATEEVTEETTEETVEETQIPTGVVLEPEAPGEAESRCDVAVVDYSNAEDGYIMVCHFGETDSRLKVLLKGPKTTYKYDLPQGSWAVFPLSDGDGCYQAGVYRNTYGTKYALVMSADFTVTMTDPFGPFLRPNQFVNYQDAPETVALGAQLCAGMENSLDKVAAVYDYVVANLTYDEEKAATVQSGYLPVTDEILAMGKGICFDYAAVMTSMLRSQGIPCKLVVGYAGSTYHAWISVWVEEIGWIYGAIYFDGQEWKRMDPTFASSAETQEAILDFIENGNYTEKYCY